MSLKRWLVRFETYYPDELEYERCIFVIGTEFSEDIAWNKLRVLLDNNCIEYTKIFWYIKHIEKINICDGCYNNILNQLGHINENGCISHE